MKVLQLTREFDRQAYPKVTRFGQQLLNHELSSEDQLRFYRMLGFASYKIHKLEEALSYANLGLVIAPNDFKLFCHRATV